MFIMDEFYVSAFSNADTSLFPKNTLTRFENHLPMTYNFKKEDNWHVCIQNVGFSTDFKNIILPNKKETPSIVIYSYNLTESEKVSSVKYNLENEDEVSLTSVASLNVFSENNERREYQTVNGLQHEANISFPDYYITTEQIANIFKNVLEENKRIQFEFNVNNNHPFKILPKFNSDVFPLKYLILIHESCQETFAIPLSYSGGEKIAKNVVINEERFYVYDIVNDWDDIVGINTKWQQKYPEYVRIKCDEILEQTFNGELSKDLYILKPQFKEEENYFVHEFENENYFPLANTSINKLSLSLTDKYNCFLNLKRGPASFIKLKFKKMFSENFFFVRAESKVNQGNGNSFDFNIPQGLYLDSNWRVALSSINFSNKYKPLPYEKELRTIYFGNLSETGKILDVHKYELPNINYTHVTQFAELTNPSLKVIDSAINFETDFRPNLFTYFSIKPGTFLSLPTEIAEILGFEYEKHRNVIHSGDFITLASLPSLNHGASRVKIQFRGFTKLNVLKPNYLMIYTDLIEPNIVGSSFANLLKIVPIVGSDSYRNEEFKHKEFHPLSSTLIKNINVTIRSHSGNLINFDEKNKVFLNLFFVRK